MELKGPNKWSDSEEAEGTDASREAPKPAPVVQPERPPLLNGIIFNRQERDRSATEVAQEITPGSFMPEQVLPPVALAAEQARAQQSALPEISEDDDDEEEGEPQATPRPQPRPPVRAPLPVGERIDTETAASTLAAELAAAPQEPRPASSEPIREPYPSFDQLAEQQFSAVPSHAELPRTPQPPPEAAHHPQSAQTEYPSTATPNTAAGEGTPPPPPPERPTPSYSEPEGWEGGGGNYEPPRQAYNTYHPQPAEYATRRSVENMQEDMRRKMAARTIMLVALAWYLGRRPAKKLREQVGGLQATANQQQAEITSLTYQQHEAQARIAEQNRQIEQFTRPAAASFQQERTPGTRYAQTGERVLPPTAEEPKIIGENGDEIVLQPGQRLERSAGGYAVVFDEHNRVVQNAIHYGEEYQRDLARERMPSPFGVHDARFAPGGLGQASAGGSVLPGSPGQTAGGYDPVTGSPVLPPIQDAGHLLTPPKPHPVLVAVTSPWLWLAVGILLIAFFAAATI
ncbi:MAG: hypothetical protein ACREGD_03030 [Candidatus Saccharimonadales bacterium]